MRRAAEARPHRIGDDGDAHLSRYAPRDNRHARQDPETAIETEW